MNQPISVAGLHISAVTKNELLRELEHRVQSGTKTFMITPYSEFLYAVLHKPDLNRELNMADYSVADGAGVVWASFFLNLPFRTKGFYAKIFEGFFQIMWTLPALLFWPKYVYKYIPEKIVGADLIWDIAEMCARADKSIYLLGGYEHTPEQVAKELQSRFPTLRIAGVSNKGPEDPQTISGVQVAGPDVLLVAFGPIRQDVWIARHLQQLPVSLAVGLGGTFDYIAGVKKAPPKVIRRSGLEWLYRLFTQPSRFHRIRNATFGLIVALLRYKVFMSMPYRMNAVVVIFNTNNEVLICKRKYELKKDGEVAMKFDQYWQFPQGGIDDGEELGAAAAREAHEETGLQNLIELKISDHTHQYTWRNGARPLWFNRLKFKGQDQRIVYFRYEGKNDDVRLDNREFEDYRWVSKKQLSVELHAERLPLVDIVLKDTESL